MYIVTLICALLSIHVKGLYYQLSYFGAFSDNASRLRQPAVFSEFQHLQLAFRNLQLMSVISCKILLAKNIVRDLANYMETGCQSDLPNIELSLYF